MADSPLFYRLTEREKYLRRERKLIVQKHECGSDLPLTLP